MRGSLEDAILLLRREPGEKGQDLRILRMMLAQRLRGFADLALARKEDEDVAGTAAPQLLGRGDDGGLERLLVVGVVRGRRPSSR